MKLRWPEHRRVITGIAIGLVTLSIYLTPHRGHETADSIPTRLIPVLLLTQGNLDFDAYLASFDRKFPRIDQHFYFLRKIGAHYVSFFPVAPGILLTPLYAPFVLYHQAQHPSPDEWLAFADRAERIAAPGIASLSVVLLYAILICMGASPARASVLSVIYAFGTNVFSNFAQHLWQHGFCAVFVEAAILVALLRRNRAGWWQFLFIGGLLGIATGCRPTTIAIASVVLVWVAEWRKERLIHLATGFAIVFAPIAIYNYQTYGSLFGGYQSRLAYATLIGHHQPLLSVWKSISEQGAIFLALLVSPGRGVLFYFPLGIVSIFGLYIALKRRDAWASLYIWLAVGALVHVFLVWLSTRNYDWVGGHSWGPRYLSEVEFVLVIMLLPALQEARTAITPSLVASLAVVSIFIQVVGVYAFSDWNSWPIEIRQLPSRVWWWRDNPVSRALGRRPVIHELISHGTVQTSPLKLVAAVPSRRVRAQHQDALLMHVPSELQFVVPDRATYVFGSFGFVPGAYRNGGATKGAEFRVSWVQANEEVELFRRFVNPSEVPGDRRLRSFAERLPDKPGGRVVFQINPGRSKDTSWGWTVWTDVGLLTDEVR